MAISDAVRDNSGISVLSQKAFEGNKVISYRANFDIYFCYSNYSHEINEQVKSKIKYTVITDFSKR